MIAATNEISKYLVFDLHRADREILRAPRRFSRKFFRIFRLEIRWSSGRMQAVEGVLRRDAEQLWLRPTAALGSSVFIRGWDFFTASDGRGSEVIVEPRA